MRPATTRMARSTAAATATHWKLRPGRGDRLDQVAPQRGGRRETRLLLLKRGSNLRAQLVHQSISSPGRSFLAARYTRVLAPPALTPTTAPTSSMGRSR